MPVDRHFRLLVDCIPLAQGGGVQVAIAFLVKLQRESDISWRAMLPCSLRAVMPPELLADPRLTFITKRPPLDRIWLHRRLRRIEREFSPDVVFTVFGPAYFRARAPQVVGFALPNLIYAPTPPLRPPGFFGGIADRLRAASFRRADHLVVETETVRERVSSLLKIDKSKISVIGNSINPILLGKAELAREPASPAEVFEILIPSAFYRHKNLDIVPRVAAAMRKIDPDLKFVFKFTLDRESAGWWDIQAEAKRIGVGDALVTLGTLPLAELAKEYGSASAVFLPTLREASTAVYPESFFFRRPLVTTDIDFARELCGDAAIFIPPFDADAIARQLVDLARSPELRQRLVEAGQRRLESGYPHDEEKFRMQMATLGHAANKTLLGRYGLADDFDILSNEDVIRGESDRGGLGMLEQHGQIIRDLRFPIENAIAFHDRLASSWDEKYTSRGFRRRAQFFDREISPLIGSSGKWLDAGCGSGYFSRRLAAKGLSVEGVDGSVSMIRAATALARKTDFAESLQFDVVETVEHLPFADQSFSGCICLSVLEYLKKPYQGLDELARVLKPSGKLVVSIPDTRSVVRRLQRSQFGAAIGPASWKQYDDFSKFSMTPAEIEFEMGKRGLTVQKIAGFDVVLPTPFHPYLPPSLNYVIATRDP